MINSKQKYCLVPYSDLFRNAKIQLALDGNNYYSVLYFCHHLVVLQSSLEPGICLEIDKHNFSVQRKEETMIHKFVCFCHNEMSERAIIHWGSPRGPGGGGESQNSKVGS